MGVRFRYVPPKVDARVAIAAAVPAAEEAGAEALLERSRKLVPVESGRLRDSGRVTPTAGGAVVGYGFDDGEYEIVGSSGDDDAPVGRETGAPTYLYAEQEHEDLTLNHPNGGQAKFLEVAMHSEHEAIRAAISERLAEVLAL